MFYLKTHKPKSKSLQIFDNHAQTTALKMIVDKQVFTLK